MIALHGGRRGCLVRSIVERCADALRASEQRRMPERMRRATRERAGRVRPSTFLRRCESLAFDRVGWGDRGLRELHVVARLAPRESCAAFADRSCELFAAELAHDRVDVARTARVHAELARLLDQCAIQECKSLRVEPQRNAMMPPRARGIFQRARELSLWRD